MKTRKYLLLCLVILFIIIPPSIILYRNNNIIEKNNIKQNQDIKNKNEKLINNKSNDLFKMIICGEMLPGDYKWKSMYFFGKPTEAQKIAYSRWIEYLLILEIHKKDNEIDELKKEVTNLKKYVVIKNDKQKDKVYVSIKNDNTKNIKVASLDKVEDAVIKPIKSDVGYVRPCSGNISQGYRNGHLAIDIADKINTEIKAISGGTIESVSRGWSGGYGNSLVINHGNGVKSKYAHFNNIYVKVGDIVDKGQVIGSMGNTGRVRGRTGVHLHLEIIVNGKKVNPISYIF
jgi:murein DD-endopeptidase MepM/ murein hydrolase activator NlpD